jgi:hypothetical protein
MHTLFVAALTTASYYTYLDTLSQEYKGMKNQTLLAIIGGESKWNWNNT